MPTHVAFLRAINLGARRKFPKDAIRAAVEGAGFAEVETHINTGNVRFATRMRSRQRIEQALETAFLTDRGFEVPTVVFTAAELVGIVRDAEELTSPDLQRHYVQLLKDEPSAAAVAQVVARDSRGHRTVVRGRAAHLLLGEGYDPGTVDPLRVERLLGVSTNRNHTVLRAIADKWC